MDLRSVFRAQTNCCVALCPELFATDVFFWTRRSFIVFEMITHRFRACLSALNPNQGLLFGEKLVPLYWLDECMISQVKTNLLLCDDWWCLMAVSGLCRVLFYWIDCFCSENCRSGPWSSKANAPGLDSGSINTFLVYLHSHLTDVFIKSYLLPLFNV